MKVARLDTEKQAIFTEWKQRENDQIKLVQESSKKLIEQMKVDAQRNKQFLEESVRAEAVKAIGRLILKQATDKITQSLTAEKHQKLNSEFAQQLQGVRA